MKKISVIIPSYNSWPEIEKTLSALNAQTKPELMEEVLVVDSSEDGKTKEFYQIGISSNTTGISVYIMGIEDKKYLPETYGKTIGKASVTGYCIKFKTLKDIRIDTLEEAIREGFKQTTIT